MFKSFIAMVLISIILLPFFVSCREDEQIEKSQSDFLVKAALSVETSLQETTQQIDEFSKEFVGVFLRSKNCHPTGDGPNSSVYYPTSYKRGGRANCFDWASAQLEASWSKFYSDAGFISWIYMYDSESGLKRILPKGNLAILFGPNLSFKSFLFYKNAVAHFPQTTWTPPTEDINGTGIISIATKAIRTNGSYISMSMDLRLGQLIKNQYYSILRLAQNLESRHTFLLGYYLTEKQQTLIGEFSTDPNQLKNLLRKNSHRIKLIPDEQMKMVQLEHQAGANSLSTFSKIISISKDEYICNSIRLTTLPLYFLLCSTR